MVNILFWNLNKKDLRSDICEIAKSSSSDVVVVIESSVPAADMLTTFRSEVSPSFHCPRCTPSRFQLFCRDVSLDLAEIYVSKRVSLRQLSYAGTELILGLIHGVDKRNWDAENQSSQVSLLANDIRQKEEEFGHSRTILIGDFNLNPFDKAMNIATGMNAMMTTKCVEPGSRILEGRTHTFFYNPLWNLLGDRTPGPSGTYYHPNSSSGHYGWNMLDQVLFRPSAIPWFDDVQILTKAGAKPLHTETGRPDRNRASDHFPILLTLK